MAKAKTRPAPKCGKCGAPVTKDGSARDKQGNVLQQYECKGPKRHKTTHPVGLEAARAEGIDKQISASIASAMRMPGIAQRFVITGAQNATPIHKKFWAALKNYGREMGAIIVVIPYRYHNPTSTWSAAAQSQDWWAPELSEYMMHKRVKLGDHMMVVGDVMIQPTAGSPLQGFETMTGDRSAVFAHPKLELIAVPTPQQRLPKLLTTTGVCTIRNYIDSKAGKKGEFHHTFGAAVVEITESGGYHLRQINAKNDGSFCELDHEYFPDKPRRPASAAGIVMGDTHVKWLDPQVERAIWGPGGMIEVLRPDELIWHDVQDNYSINHHHRKQLLVNYVKHHTGNNNVREELKQTADFIWERARRVKRNVFVSSNHPRWLAQWVAETDPRQDLENCVFWAETFQLMAKSAKMGVGGAEYIDPFVEWMQRMLPPTILKRCKFLGADESHLVKGIEVGMHGDRGANGAKGSPRTFGKLGVKNVTGDGHSPWIKDGAYRVGTSTRTRLEYTHGPSSWLQTMCIIYGNGKRTLSNVIDGEWRL